MSITQRLTIARLRSGGRPRSANVLMPIRLNNLHAHQSLAAELYQGKKKYKTKITQKLEAWIHTKGCRSFRSQWKYACVHNGRNKDWIWTILMSIILQTVARALLKIALELEIVRICWLRQSYQRVSYHSVIKSGGRDGWWKDCRSSSLLILPILWIS